jgi:hypothetical protein
MLASLIIWTYIFILSYIYGWTIVDGFRRLFAIKVDLATFSQPLLFLVGLCGINTIAALLSLFINLGWLAQVIFLLMGLGFGLRMWMKRFQVPSIKMASIPWWLILFGLLVFLTVLENGTHTPVNPDTGIYHAQAIRWMETYPTVPGLGNLHSRFAYDSNWLVINALFSFSFLGIRSFHVLPGAFVLIALAYFMGGTYKLLKREVSIVTLMKTLLIPLVFYILGSQISSPGTDFPTTVWIWITILVWLEAVETRRKTLQKTITIEEILAFFFSVYLITVKLSAFPLLLLSALMLIKYIRINVRVPLKLFSLALIVLTPWFARNLILSGYLVYPMPMLSLLSPNWDWKIPLDKVVNEQQVIQAWARIPRRDAGFVLGLPIFSWLKEWFLNLTLNQRVLVLGAISSPAIFGFSSLFIQRKIPDYRFYLYAYLVSYCGLMFWLFGAPDIRFGFGFIILTSLLAGSPLVVWVINKFPHPNMIVMLLLSLIIVYQASVLFRSVDYKTLIERILLPADYGDLPTSPCNIHGYTLLCADDYNECWYGPFPCIPPSSADPHVELRGDSLRNGFRYIDNP